MLVLLLLMTEKRTRITVQSVDLSEFAKMLNRPILIRGFTERYPSLSEVLSFEISSVLVARLLWIVEKRSKSSTARKNHMYTATTRFDEAFDNRCMRLFIGVIHQACDSCGQGW